ncbi:MAG: murein tripeptide amidase MpaA [Verrucomicrobiales bacterium]|nr:murein tripeptide amidase MpaA [Verrucomicrobiales bacterium]MDA7644120.1 murein tripeptide amidase MpaA [Verrucomicrobiales bacterium]MDA7644137.1 murein tripeptide amidase MpaA [Verrucomicrobiales bacterium]MDF1785744.1 murein tripeptide amidase MpaA [Verrucomicrobiales bacterium]
MLRSRLACGQFVSEPEIYGRTFLGQRLEIWLPPSESVRTLVFAGIHGEEPETSVVLSRSLRALAEPLERCAVVVAANPDGLIRGTRGNARGVDLNRNFPTRDWQPDPVTHRWVVEEPSEVVLSTGEAPGSEPESQALVALVEKLEPSRVIAMHAPLACIDDPEASPEAHWLSEQAQLPVVSGVGYLTPGSFGTWCAERQLPVITYEFPRKSVEQLVLDHLPALTQVLSGSWPFD